MEFKVLNLKAGLWIYLNVGKYRLQEDVYEERVALDLFVGGHGFSICKVFKTAKESKVCVEKDSRSVACQFRN
jgi:hypothetical protein